MSKNASLTRRQLYSAIGSVKDYAAGYQEKFLGFLSTNLLSEHFLCRKMFLVILGCAGTCSRMLLIFGTSQSEQCFPLGCHKY